MSIPIADQLKEFYNNMSHEEMPELKKSDLNWVERIIYWWNFRKARRHFIKEQRKVRSQADIDRFKAVANLGWSDFYKWKEYANALPKKNRM